MQGKTIALLEARLSKQLAELVAKCGGRPFLAPALREVPNVDQDYVARLVREWQSNPAGMVIFQTGVGTRALFETTDALGLTEKLFAYLAATTVVVRGPKPTAVLRARGVRIDVSAPEPFTTVEVLAAIAATDLRGKRVVVQRFGETNPDLEQGLKKMGAQVIEIPTYKWALPEDTKPMVDLMDALSRREIDAAVFTTSAQVNNLFHLAGELARGETLTQDLNNTFVASIGPVCSKALRDFQVKVSLEASPPKLGPLVAALDKALS